MVNLKFLRQIISSFTHWFLILPGEPVGVGSVAGGGRYDNLVGMFDPRKRKVRQGYVLYDTLTTKTV